MNIFSLQINHFNYKKQQGQQPGITKRKHKQYYDET